MSTVFEYLKRVAIIAFVFGSLHALGLMVNNYVDYSYLKDIFRFVIDQSKIFSFFWDTETTFLLVAYSLLIEVGIWALRGALAALDIAGWRK